MMKLKHQPEYYNSKFFKWRQRIGFGVSDYACNLAYLLANTYLLFYYTNCAGITAGDAGFMFVVTKIIDAVTDYLVGVWVDHTDTKMGRYRPWMLAGAPILAVGMVLLFSVPVSWAYSAKVAWAYISYIIFSFGYTVVNIPMTPVVTSLSSNAVERTKITITRNMFASLGSLTSSLFVLPLVYFFSKGIKTAGPELAYGYRMTNVVLGVIVVVIMCICVFNIEEVNPPTVAKKKESILKDTKNIFKNKYYILMVLNAIFFNIGYLAVFASIQYYYTYVVGNTDAMALAMSLMTLVPIPVMLLGGYLNSHGIGKGRMIFVGAIIDVLGMLLLLTAKTSVMSNVAISIFAVGAGLRNSMMFAALPDIFDYTEYHVGKTLAGTQTAAIAFGGKLASAISTALVSALLVWGNYNADEMDTFLAAGGTVAGLGEAYPQAILAIKIAFIGLSLVTSVVCAIVMSRYDLDKKYPEIRAELDKRRENA